MSKKQTKASVPKRIAGVKVPKSVRRGLKDLARSDSGKAVITQALAAAGAALTALQTPPNSGTRPALREAGPPLKDAAQGASDRTINARAALGAAFEDATRTFTDSLRRRSDESAASALSEEPAGSTH